MNSILLNFKRKDTYTEVGKIISIYSKKDNIVVRTHIPDQGCKGF